MPTTPPHSIAVGIEDIALPDSADAADVADVADSIVRLIRSFSRIKAQIMSEATHNVEWAASMLINRLAAEGPMRSSALAELVQSDPSTVSRQVAALVKDGLVERRADPVDGRASMLAVTATGQQVYEDHKRIRNEHYQQLLAGWDHAEVRLFAAQLARFADRFDQTRPNWLRGVTDSGSEAPQEET
ncbi:MAG: MarR family transcriptional regulator [Pseudonocardiales bacterium]|nr:MarR family transcriptional regulator [Pseudonocardiales bacterium]